MKNFLRRNAFTLTELLIVVIVIGLIAGFAIPNYQKSVERAHRRDAETNLMAMHAANSSYRAEFGFFWPGDVGVFHLIGDINNTIVLGGLGMAIIENGFTYHCFGFAGGGYQCDAQRGGYTVSIDQNPIALGGGNPFCAPAINCP